MLAIQTINPLTLPLLQPLSEGCALVQTLWNEYTARKVTFRENGALLLGGYHEEHLIAVGDVHPDPYLNSPIIGRIRHVYVLPSHRRQGIAKALMDQSAQQFTIFTLRTLTDHGRAFYADLGFTDAPRFPDATHWLARTNKHNFWCRIFPLAIQHKWNIICDIPMRLGYI